MHQITVTIEEIEALIEDEPRKCEHSAHHRGGNHDTGTATHWILCIHDCDGGEPSVYPGCATWAVYVARMQDEWWQCKSCLYIAPGREMARVIGPIH